MMFVLAVRFSVVGRLTRPPGPTGILAHAAHGARRARARARRYHWGRVVLEAHGAHGARGPLWPLGATKSTGPLRPSGFVKSRIRKCRCRCDPANAAVRWFAQMISGARAEQLLDRPGGPFRRPRRGIQREAPVGPRVHSGLLLWGSWEASLGRVGGLSYFFGSVGGFRGGS